LLINEIPGRDSIEWWFFRNAYLHHWITFDCFGTLIDWNCGFAAILRPLAENKTDDLLRAYHRFERVFEAERPHRLYKDVLTMSLLGAAREVGVPLDHCAGGGAPAAMGINAAFRGRGRSTGKPAQGRLQARRSDQL
jgi:hypothetical protein